ncbi:MAG: hypothetical protein ACK4IX_14430, partial [Candidatus Sericytochromatia bacterium]
MNYVNRLNIEECKEFISYFLSKIETEGLMRILKDYIQISERKITIAIKSLYDNLSKNISFQNSIREMAIKFPLCLEDILINSIENSVLDYALKDLNNILENNYSESDSLEDISRLVDKYANNLKTDIICEDCLLNELEKILKRAEIEKAYEIRLEQDNEKYFIQNYIGIKSVKYTEPSHSKTYKTLLMKFNKLSKNIDSLLLFRKNIYIRKIEEMKFTLSYDENFI